jgi:hypothetical protein
MHRVVAVAIPEVFPFDRLSREIATTPTAYRRAFRGDPRRNVREPASA